MWSVLLLEYNYSNFLPYHTSIYMFKYCHGQNLWVNFIKHLSLLWPIFQIKRQSNTKTVTVLLRVTVTFQKILARSFINVYFTSLIISLCRDLVYPPKKPVKILLRRASFPRGRSTDDSYKLKELTCDLGMVKKGFSSSLIQCSQYCCHGDLTFRIGEYWELPDSTLK